MLRIVGLFTVLFTILLTIFWTRSIDEAARLTFVWRYDLRANTSTTLPSDLRGELNRSGDVPFNLVLSRESIAGTEEQPPSFGEAPVLKGPGVGEVPLAEDRRIFVPFLAGGYFSYQKVGRELIFHGRTGEELWRKEYKPYPVSDPWGRIVLLLTGDNNRVDLIDANGNVTGAGSVSGNFMTDFDFSAAGPAAISFSGGEVYVLDVSGRIVLKLAPEQSAVPMFVKSTAISPDGKIVAVHLLEGDADVLRVFRVPEPDDADAPPSTEATQLDVIDLQIAYPHLLHFSVSNAGLLLAAPDRTLFHTFDAGESWVRERETGAVYRPVYAATDFFAYGDGNEVIVLNHAGREVVRIPVDTAGEHFRLLPGPRPSIFAIHSDERVEMYEYVLPN